jgi:hypothetical protein
MAGLFNGKKKARPMAEDEEVEAGPPQASARRAPPGDEAEGAPMGEGDAPMPADDPGAAGEAPDSTGGGAAKKFVDNGMRLIYSQKTLPAIIRSLDGDGNPVEGLLNTLGMVMSRLIEAAEQNGVAMTPDVVLTAAGQMVKKLSELSKSAGGHTYSPQELEQAGQFVAEAVAGGNAPPAEAPPAAGPPGPMAEPPPRRGLLG